MMASQNDDWEDFLHSYTGNEELSPEEELKSIKALAQVSEMEHTPVRFLTTNQDLIRKTEKYIEEQNESISFD